LKKHFLLPVIFVSVYLTASALLLSVFGGAGHGWGITAFYYLGLPLSYISIILGDAFNSGEVAMLSCLLAGIVQYALLGYLVQVLVTRGK
jgi:hypothetical protein